MCGYLWRKGWILRVNVTSHQQSAFTEFTCGHMYIHHEVLLLIWFSVLEVSGPLTLSSWTVLLHYVYHFSSYHLGCGKLWVTDGIWKLNFAHCMYHVQVRHVHCSNLVCWIKAFMYSCSILWKICQPLISPTYAPRLLLMVRSFVKSIVIFWVNKHHRIAWLPTVCGAQKEGITTSEHKRPVCC